MFFFQLLFPLRDFMFSFAYTFPSGFVMFSFHLHSLKGSCFSYTYTFPAGSLKLVLFVSKEAYLSRLTYVAGPSDATQPGGDSYQRRLRAIKMGFRPGAVGSHGKAPPRLGYHLSALVSGR